MEFETTQWRSALLREWDFTALWMTVFPELSPLQLCTSRPASRLRFEDFQPQEDGHLPKHQGQGATRASGLLGSVALFLRCRWPPSDRECSSRDTVVVCPGMDWFSCDKRDG